MGDPERIGGYAIARRLGSGGQGVVYEAYGRDGQRVALKALHQDAAVRRPFDKEVTAARRVAAFCTARILDTDLDGAQPYIVSEYVPGPSLREAVSAQGPYTGEDLRRLAIGIATAMAAIHDAGVAHCDLKPDNVLLGPDGPRVIDFGIARIVENSLTLARGVIGTPGYMAPELFSGGLPTPASDVFAWGAVMVFAATGQAPFAKPNVAAVIYDVLRGDVDLGPMREPLRALVAASLAKDPAARPAARDLLLGLLGGGQPDLLDAGSREAAEVAGGGSAVPPLGERAEAAFAALSPAEQGLAKQALLRMVRPGAAGDDLVGVGREELADLAETTVEPVIDALADAGVVREAAEGGLTLAHAALLQAWPRLRDLIDDERGGLVTYQALRHAARNWDEHGRREADLYQGVSLEEATRWASASRRHLELGSAQRDFLTASAGLAQRRIRRRRILTAALAVLTVAAVGLATLSQINSNAAQQASRQATARGLAARAETLRESDPAAALLLSAASARVQPGTDAERALLGALAQQDVVRRSSNAIGVGEDGRSLIELRGDTAIITDAVTGRQLGQVPGVDPGTRFAYLSADRTTLATLACETPANCDNDPKVVAVHAGGRVDAKKLQAKPDQLVNQLFFEGHTLLQRRAPCGTSPVVMGEPAPGSLVACTTGTTSFGLADARTGRVVSSRSIEKGKRLLLAQLSPDGRLLAALWSWDFTGPHGRGEGISGIDLWSVDGTRLVRHVARGELPAYDAPWQGSGAGPCPRRMAFSNSGAVLAVEYCGQVVLWGNTFFDTYPSASKFFVPSWPQGLAPLELLGRFEQPSGSELAFTVDDRLLTALGGGELRVSDAEPYARPGFSLRQDARDAPVRSAVFSPDGRILATMDERALRLVEVASGKTLHALTGPWVSPLWSSDLDIHPTASPIVFSSDGTLLAVNGQGAEALLVDVATGTVRSRVAVPGQAAVGSDILAMDFSPDGSALAMSTWGHSPGSPNAAIRVWNTKTGHATATLANEIAVAVRYRPDGKGILTAHPDQGICDVDPDKGVSSCPGASGKIGFRLPGYLTTNLGFSPDGTKVVLRMDDGSVVLWDPRTKQLVSPIMRGHTEGAVTSAAFAPDGKTLATGGQDNTVRLWDLTTGIAIGLPFRHNGDVLAVTFSRDGKSLHSVDAAGGVQSYPLDLDRASRTVCAKAGRDLTPAERAVYSVPTAGACRS